MYLGMICHNAYGEAVKWKTQNGEPMTEWNDLPACTQAAWAAAADKVRMFVAAFALQEAVNLGYGGVLPGGQLVDRRLHPDAMPISKNLLLGIGEQKDVAHSTTQNPTP